MELYEYLPYGKHYDDEENDHVLIFIASGLAGGIHDSLTWKPRPQLYPRSWHAHRDPSDCLTATPANLSYEAGP